MTCLPLSLKPARYFCACDSEQGDLNTEIAWADTWDYFGSVSSRMLCASQDGWCLDGMFRKNQEGYLVDNYALLDSQIIVSSVYSATYPKESIRVIDLSDKCGWLKADSDSSPWVKFDLLRSYTAVVCCSGRGVTREMVIIMSRHLVCLHPMMTSFGLT